jgi:hypothetical protein
MPDLQAMEQDLWQEYWEKLADEENAINPDDGMAQFYQDLTILAHCWEDCKFVGVLRMMFEDPAMHL